MPPTRDTQGIGQRSTTLDDLAAMINRGFTQTQKAFNGLKDDVDGLKDDIDGVKHIQQDIRKELSATPADVRYLRCSAEPLTRHEAERDALLLLKDLMARVPRLE